MTDGDEDGIARAKTRRVRKDGWTAKKKATFLDHLAASCNVARSAEAVG